MPPQLKRDGAYYRLQKRIPLDIMREVAPEARKRVLGTASGVVTKYLGSDLKDAKRRLPAELAALEDKFAELRGDVSELPAEAVVWERVEAAAYAWLQDLKGLQRAEMEGLLVLRPSQRESVVNRQLEPWLDGVHRGDWSSDRDVVVTKLLAGYGVKIAVDHPLFPAARRMVAVSYVDAYRAVLAELEGNYNYAPHIPKREFVEVEAPNGPSPALTVVHQRWMDDRERNPRTALEWAAAVSLFVEVVGDIPVAAITADHIRDFRNALSKAPKSFRKRYPGKTLPEVLALTKHDAAVARLSLGSVAKYLRALGAVLGFAVAQGYVVSSPMPKIVAADAGDGKQRLSFSTEDLNKLFGISVFTTGARPTGGAGEAAKYLPLLGLFTGARLEELGQALVSDIRREGDVWFLDINEVDAGKSLKTKSSRRMVPLHPELIRCGFLGYVRELAAAGETRLFPLLKANASGKLTANWSKWFNRVKREEAGILVPARAMKDFHSFRHGFKDACRAARIPEEVSDALTGHSGGGIGRRYGSNGIPLDVKADAVKLVRFDGLKLDYLYVADPVDAS